MLQINFLSLITLMFVLSFSFTVIAEDFDIQLQDRNLKVNEVDYYEGTLYPRMARLNESHRFELIRDNYIEASDYIWFYKQGEVSIAVNLGYLNWVLADGSSIILDCSFRVAQNRNRIVSFHQNKSYHRGCSIASQHMFEHEGFYHINARFGGSLDLHPNSDIKYSARISKDSFIIAPNGSKSYLADNSEVSIYQNKRPHFFTLGPGETYIQTIPNIGKVAFGTRPNKKIAIILSKDGHIKSGAPISPITIKIDKKSVIINLEAAQFYPTGELSIAIFSANTIVPKPLKPYILVLPKGRGQALCLDEKGHPRQTSYCSSSH